MDCLPRRRQTRHWRKLAERQSHNPRCRIVLSLSKPQAAAADKGLGWCDSRIAVIQFYEGCGSQWTKLEAQAVAAKSSVVAKTQDDEIR